jgi:hypothetical protein
MARGNSTTYAPATRLAYNNHTLLHLQEPKYISYDKKPTRRGQRERGNYNRVAYCFFRVTAAYASLFSEGKAYNTEIIINFYIHPFQKAESDLE